MKALILSLLIVCAGCTATQQKIAYNTIYSVEVSTKATYDGYLTLVVKGQLPTNSVPQVTKVFNDFQASATLATVATQNNTNALAPSSLVDEANAVINLINTVKGAK